MSKLGKKYEYEEDFNFCSHFNTERSWFWR